MKVNIKTFLEAQAHLAHQKHMNRLRAGISHGNRILRAVVTRNADEPGAAQARAIDKVLALP